MLRVKAVKSRKFSEEQIMKALDCCERMGVCKRECPLSCIGEFDKCFPTLLWNISEILKTKNEENNKLKYQVNRLKHYDKERDIALHSQLIAKSKLEGAMEMYSTLKEQVINLGTMRVIQEVTADICIRNMEQRYEK